MSSESTNARSPVGGHQRELESYEQRTAAQPDVQQIHGPIYREKAEPRDGYQPIPMWLLLPVFALLLWGGWYLGAHSWDFRPDQYDGTAALTRQPGDGTPRSTKQLDPMVLAAARVVRGQREAVRLRTPGGERLARLSGRLRNDAPSGFHLPAVGDWVAVRIPPGDGEAVVHAVLPRRTVLIRKVPENRPRLVVSRFRRSATSSMARSASSRNAGL